MMHIVIGLRLTLNVETSEYLGMFSHEQGAVVAVHANNITSFPEDDGLVVSAGHATEIAASMVASPTHKSKILLILANSIN